MQAFSDRVGAISRRSVRTVQVNIGKLCNLACRHCHVDAGPNKVRENMSRETVARILEVLKSSPGVAIVDITGGAPELHPHFRDFVGQIRRLGKEVWDRCNLTVLLEPGQHDTVAFLAEQRVRVIASLPCYSAGNVEKQRGDGVFMQSIEALTMLNRVGYAEEGSGLYLDLVYNPVGPTLPPDQAVLKGDYKKRLHEDFGIVFDELYTITNMPIKRFLVDLKRQGQERHYQELLVNAFNPCAAEEVMCRDMISISWDGKLYDCDFNQALALDPGRGPRSVFDLECFDELIENPVTVADHCYGCTAGAGSSCGGVLT